MLRNLYVPIMFLITLNKLAQPIHDVDTLIIPIYR